MVNFTALEGLSPNSVYAAILIRDAELDPLTKAREHFRAMTRRGISDEATFCGKKIAACVSLDFGVEQ
jgi:hypothetical protein